MRLETDSMTRPVHEELGQSGPGQDTTRRGVDLLARASGPHRVHSSLLGREQHVVAGAVLLARITEGVRPRAVGAVAIRHRASDVDHHGIARLEDAIADLVMRARTVGAARDDDEVDGHVTGGVDELGDIGRHIALRSPRSKQAGNSRVHTVDRLAGAGQGLDLAGLLDHAHAIKDRAGELLPHLWHGVTQPQDLGCPHVVIDGDDGGLRQQPGDEVVGVLRLSPGVHVQMGGGTGLSRHDLQTRDDQSRCAVCADDQAGQALERDGVVPDQVAQIRPRGDQSSVDAGPSEIAGKTVQTVIHARPMSAGHDRSVGRVWIVPAHVTGGAGGRGLRG